MKSLPSQLVVDEERKDDPGRGVNGERTLLDNEINNDKQWDWEQRRKKEHPAGTKYQPAQPFGS